MVYQIYPRSFADSNGDGIGDLRGVLAHMDHIENLGIDAIWLCPVYSSPQADNGYDIADYRSVDPVFGTLADLDALIADCDQRGMKLIMDLVVNHTSDQHPWFLESRTDRVNPKQDWYIWRDPRPGTVGGEPGAEPNNWEAAFSGPAWHWVPERAQYYLHLFSAQQPDLNWDIPAVREAIFSMMSWWLDRGIAGFRMDVINYLSKDPALPDAPASPSGLGDGTPFFAPGPHLHDYLAEMNQRVLHRHGQVYLTVGEMPGVTTAEAREFTDREYGKLSMVFQFEHMAIDQAGDKWTHRAVTVHDLREVLGRWQIELADRGWNSLYWNNHDQPRVVSRFGNDTRYRRESATALALLLHLHRGTPYVYQGEELGMTNLAFQHVEEFRDIESLRYYEDRVDGHGDDPEQTLVALRRSSRDNARTPMQWNAEPGAGFTDGIPWITLNPNYVRINAAEQYSDDRSVYHFYRALIALRHDEPVAVDGDFSFLMADDPQVYAFRRSLGADTIDVYVNLSDTAAHLPASHVAGLSVLLGNYRDEDRHPGTLGPWEGRAYRGRAADRLGVPG
ncbi:MAG: oligo-1,6-glucosidase [Marmoricola sp.]